MVRGSWTLLDASEAEALTFAGLDATLALECTPAAPPNRLRRAFRVEVEGHDYYLKVFLATQPKNRIRNRLTRPRCDLDAEREHAVAEALRARGIPTARPIARGRRRGASFYLCAAVAGRSVRALREAGAWPADGDRRLAAFCGGIAARGVVLPDLSADHVFADDRGAFAVIDLHNGRVGRLRRREAVRMLRRFARSVHGLGISRARALRFAARMLRAAGLDRTRRRAVVRRVPPFDTFGRYDAAGRAVRYRGRDSRRATRELELLDRVWPGRPGERVLDVPCGAGRLQRVAGPGWIAADRSAAMLEQARRTAPTAPRVLCDAAVLPFADRAVDGVVVFRFLHHLGPGAARAVVLEAARVAGSWLVVSHFQPLSAHHARRRLRDLLRAHARTRYALRRSTLERWLADAGFEPTASAGEGWLKDLRVAAFRRCGAP